MICVDVRDPHFCKEITKDVASKNMGYKFNEIAGILDIHPVTEGRCAEKGKKMVDNYEEIWMHWNNVVR